MSSAQIVFLEQPPEEVPEGCDGSCLCGGEFASSDLLEEHFAQCFEQHVPAEHSVSQVEGTSSKIKWTPGVLGTNTDITQLILDCCGPGVLLTCRLVGKQWIPNCDVVLFRCSAQYAARLSSLVPATMQHCLCSLPRTHPPRDKTGAIQATVRLEHDRSASSVRVRICGFLGIYLIATFHAPQPILEHVLVGDLYELVRRYDGVPNHKGQLLARPTARALVHLDAPLMFYTLLGPENEVMFDLILTSERSWGCVDREEQLQRWNSVHGARRWSSVYPNLANCAMGQYVGKDARRICQFQWLDNMDGSHWQPMKRECTELPGEAETPYLLSF